MRRIRYQVAASLDGFIAGPGDEFDWIGGDPDLGPENAPTFDFDAHFAQFDTLLMGRRTYDGIVERGETYPGKQIIVVSRTLRADEHPDITVLGEDGLTDAVDDLRGAPGGDIWLFGGGLLFRTLLDLDRVDTVEPAVIPILLGEGVPLLPGPHVRRRLALTGHQVYRGGMVLLEYEVVGREGRG